MKSDTKSIDTPPMGDEISLLDLASIIWRRKVSVAVAVIVSITAAVLYLNNAAYTYTAQMKVVPVQGGTSGKVGGTLAGLAAIAGIHLPSGSESASFDLYLDGLTSIETARVLAANQEIMHTIFATEWDRSSRRWRPSASFLSVVIAWGKEALGIPVQPWHAPDALRLRDYLVKKVNVSQPKSTDVTTVSFDHADRVFAVQLLDALNTAVDERLRARALERADASIAYLNRKLEAVHVAEYRQALIQTLSEQEKLRMMASSGLPFAADLVSGPEASVGPTEPRPFIILVLMTLFGVVAGVLYAYFRYALANALAARRIADAVPGEQ